MGKYSIGLECGLNFARRMFGKGGKSARKAAKAASAKVQPMTRALTNPMTGAVKGLEREITLAGGKQGLARVNYLGEGKRKITIYTEENRPFLWETKNITRENGGSVFGGNRINIDKDKTMHGCYGEKVHLQKDYSKAGTLEHKELNLVHDSGNGLNDYSRKAAMDKVYAEYPLKSGYKDMLGCPSDTVGIQHSLSNGSTINLNNYGKFNQEGTNYRNAIEAKRVAEQARIAKAEAEAAAAVRAEQEAAAKLAASRPRVNTGKIFNKNIDEFKCIEETRADGSVVRRYFDPYASNSKSNPMITTIDLGNYHREIIYDPRKGLKLTYKQIGEKEPEIEMTKGWQHRYSSKYNEKLSWRDDVQVYNDGLNYVEADGFDPSKCLRAGQVVVKNPNSAEIQAQRGEPEYIRISDKCLTYQQNSALNKRLREILQGMSDNKVDLMDYFKPYQA